MTAIVNNTCFSSNRGGNFQCFFSLILILTYFTPSQYEWQLLPPMWKGALNFVFFSFLLEANVAMQKQSTGCKWSTQKGGEVGSFPFFLARFGEKKGSRIKMGMTFAINGGLLCASHWCTVPNVSLEGWDLNCKFALCWPFSKVDRQARAWFPHTPYLSFSPPQQTPIPPTSLLTSACPSGLNRSHDGNG